MKIKIKNKNGIVLKTKDTIVTEDIEVIPDESIINGSGEYEDGDEMIFGGVSFTNTYIVKATQQGDLNARTVSAGMVLYSTDGGSSWIDAAIVFRGETNPITVVLVENAAQIKFKTATVQNYSYCPTVSSSTLGFNLQEPGETENFILNQDVLDIIVDVGVADSGGWL